MGWTVSGQWTESCTCSVTCPCNLNEDPTHGYCDVAFCFEINQGHVDAVDVSGIPVVWTLNLPGTFLGGNATARLYIDERAGQEQRAALEAIFRGKNGGVWTALSGIVARWLPTKFVPITATDGDTGSITVGDLGTIHWNAVKDHRGEKAVIVNPPLLTPFSVREYGIAKGDGTEWHDPDMKSWSGVTAGRTTFRWSSEDTIAA